MLAQETGFSAFLPVGEGLIPFETIDDAVAGVEDLRRDYERHRRAARALAEDVFDSDKVLAGLSAGSALRSGDPGTQAVRVQDELSARRSPDSPPGRR